MGDYPKQYPPVASAVIANYDWTDIAAGAGYVNFYLTTAQKDGDASTSPTLLYYLVDQTIDVGDYPDITNAASTRSSYLGDTVKSFSTTFNISRDIEGKALFQFTLMGSSGTNANRTFTAKILKNSTELCSETAACPGQSAIRTYNLMLDIPRTHLSVGDELKVSVEVTGTNPYIFILHDPLDRDRGAVTVTGGLGNLNAVSASDNHTYALIKIPFIITE